MDATKKGVVYDAASAIREADRLAAAREEAKERIEREVAGMFVRRRVAAWTFGERWGRDGAAYAEAR